MRWRSIQLGLIFSAMRVVDWVMAQDFSNTARIRRGSDNFCLNGYRYDMKKGCIDINECIEKVPCRINQSCRNIYGSYICICPPGLQLDALTGECVDRDECALGYCGSGQICTNTFGSFTCNCAKGTTKIGRFCRDINECIRKPCDENQNCINTKGSYLCLCQSGFHNAGSGKCTDTNECQQNVCQGLGEVCRNTVGGYECLCREGFAKDQLTNGRYCIDVNECDLDQCQRNSECINTQGSYYCRCHRGFTKYNGYCLDNQECSLGEGKKCQWKCVNLPGSFKCKCPIGYSKVDYSCTDINECDAANKRKLCGNRGTCVNTHGGYNCMEPPRCPSGGYYRKLTTTDEFGYRQITTNMCRKKRCRRVTNNEADLAKCREQPLSISYHYVDITSGLKVPTDIMRVDFPARRREQIYYFSISENQDLFELRQPSPHGPRAYLYLKRTLTGPAEYTVHVDMRTYNRRKQMRDSRMMTITIIVSRYEF